MGLLKALLNLNNAEGIREAMRNSYKAHRRQAEKGKIETDFAPHIVGLMGAMESRMKVNGLNPTPTNLWLECAPFALIGDPEVGVEALAEYAVYVERTVDAKLEGLRETVNLWIKRASCEDRIVMVLVNPLCQHTRWWALLENDSIQHVESLRVEVNH